MNYYQMTEVLFRAWYANWATVAVANATTLGISLPQQGTITTAQTNYASSVSAYTTAHDAAKTATNNKNAAYAAAFEQVQLWSNQWQADPAISDALKISLGLNIRDTTPSPRPIFAVSDLSGSGNSVGTVRLRWNRGANLPGCSFIVQSRPVGGEWTFLTVTGKTRIAIGSQALVPTEYRVLVERRGNLSAPCDPVVVYSDGGSMELFLLDDVA
jgi:hypothetical protein